MKSPWTGIGLAIATFLGTTFGFVQALFAWKSYRRTERVQAAPRSSVAHFKIFSSDELALLRAYKQECDVRPRQVLSAEKDDAELFDRLLVSESLLVAGARGVGKTRLCLDLIERLCVQKGERVTILMPEEDFDRPMESVPDGVLGRNVILWVDDLNLYLAADDERSVTRPEIYRSLSERIRDSVRFFDAHTVDFRLVVSGATDDVTLDAMRAVIGQPRCEEVLMHPLRAHEVKKFAEATAATLGLSLAPDAVNEIVRRSDLTCAGIVTAFQSLKLERGKATAVISASDCSQYQFEYPKDWDRVVYPKYVATSARRLAIFQALAALRRMRSVMWKGLVVELAARFLPGPKAWNRIQVRRTLENDLQWTWLSLEEDRVRCDWKRLRPVRLPDGWFGVTAIVLRKFASGPGWASMSDVQRSFIIRSVYRGDPNAGDALVSVLLRERGRDPGVLSSQAMALMAVDAPRALGIIDEVIAGYAYAPAHIVRSTVLSRLDRDGEAVDAARRAADLAPEQAGAWLVLGVVLSKQGEIDDALTALRHASSLTSGNAKVAYSLGIVLEQKAGRVAGDEKDSTNEEAARYFKLATDLAPSDRMTWLARGIFESRRGHYDTACDHLEAALRLASSKNQAVVVALARALSQANRFERAEGLLKELIASRPLRVAPRIRLLEVLLRAGAIDRALDLVTELLDLELEPGHIREITKRFERADAADAIGKLIDRVRRMRDAAHQRASSEFREDVPPQRTQVLEALLVGVLIAWGSHLRRQKMYSDALRYAEEAQSLSPTDPAVLRLVGECKYQLEDYRAAELLFERATKEGGCRGLGELPVGLADWKKLEKQAFEERNSALFYEAAEQAFKLQLIAPDEWTLIISDMPRLAPQRTVTFVRQLVDQYGEDDRRMHLLAFTLKHAGDYVEAAVAGERAVELAKGDKNQYRYVLGRIYDLLGDEERALMTFQAAPGHRRAEERVREIFASRNVLT